MTESILPLLGVALCATALLQLLLWSGQSFTQWSHTKKQFEISREALRKQIEAVTVDRTEAIDEFGKWNGYREFVVDELVRETKLSATVYLKPGDRKSIVSFRPGQHMTFKFDIPGQSKPLVRCYSLSAGPGDDRYRITVKTMRKSNPEAAPGRVSTFVNQSLMVGDRVQVKAPTGHFFLDEGSTAPAVLLAGGIGITPMVSMIDHIVRTKSERKVILVYGSRNSEDHTFKNYLKDVSERIPNIFVINVYSEPLAQDKEGVDFHVPGLITIELLKQLLPNNHCQFYLCGPSPFMEAMNTSLIEWQVPDSRIFSEAFGPASVKRTKTTSDDDAATPSAQVQFTSMQESICWDHQCESLLELAEANGIVIDSGCRAGSCGTCQTPLLRGQVKYPSGMQVDCDPGQCFTCIAQPDGDVELDV